MTRLLIQAFTEEGLLYPRLARSRPADHWGELVQEWFGTAPTDVPLIGLSFQCSSISVTETHDTCTFKFRFSTLIVEIKMTIFDRLRDAVCYEHLLHKEEQHGNYDPTSARVFACRSETWE